MIDNTHFYSTWLEKAVKGIFDDLCLLINDREGNIHGFVSIRKLPIEKEARIGLLTTVLAHQRK
ncbi:MAG: hypothetical protein ACTS73_03230 [Arsenophonus sp. NEOnobi-MAG3]